MAGRESSRLPSGPEASGGKTVPLAFSNIQANYHPYQAASMTSTDLLILIGFGVPACWFQKLITSRMLTLVGEKSVLLARIAASRLGLIYEDLFPTDASL